MCCKLILERHSRVVTALTLAPGVNVPIMTSLNLMKVLLFLRETPLF